MRNSTSDNQAMSKLLNILGFGQKKYPRLQLSVPGEGVSYSMPDKTLYVAWTHIDGQRIYTDSIDKWEKGATLTAIEKSTAFMDIVAYMRKQTREKLIIVINSDFDRTFWENECEKLKNEIKSIEYTSDKEKDDFLYNMYLETIPNLTIDGIKISNKADLDNYWQTRKKGDI